VLARHGLEPFVQAAGTGGQGGLTWLLLLFFDFTEEPFLTLTGAVAFIGLFASLVRKPRFLPLWLVLNPLIQPRGLSSFTILPLAMLFGSGLSGVILPGLRRLQQGQDTAEPPDWVEAAFGFRLGKLFCAFALWQMVASAFFGAAQIQGLTLSQADRQAMAWIAGSTPKDSRFLVISRPIENCPLCDPALEWFPTLAERSSINTVQGKEWGQAGEWQNLMDRNNRLQACLDQNVDCVTDWAEQAQAAYTHVYVRSPAPGGSSASTGASSLGESLNNAPGFRRLYANSRVSVFALSP
jgi:hypothetical protein